MSGRISGCAHLTCFKTSKNTDATGSLGDFSWCFIIFVLRKLFLNLILSCSRDSRVLFIWRLISSFDLFFPRTEQLCFFELSQLVHSFLNLCLFSSSLFDSLKMHCVSSDIENWAQYGDANCFEHFPLLPKALINQFSASLEAPG